jgi:hypothetical protein
MPDKGSEKIKRLTQIKPVKAHKKLQRGSERPDAAPLALVSTKLTKRPPRNKG